MKGEQSSLGDAKLQAMINQLLIKEPKDLKCASQKQITKMCVNPECKLYSLMCSFPDCQPCKEDNHEDCDFILLRKITNSLNKEVERKKETVTKIEKIENLFINLLKETNLQLVKNKNYGRMEQKYRKIVDEIFAKKNNKCLKGKQAFQFYSNIKKLSEPVPSNNTDSFLKEYEKTLQGYISHINVIKENITESLKQVEQKEDKEKIKVILGTDSIIKAPEWKEDEPKIEFDSAILRESVIESSKCVKFLTDCLLHPTKIELLFRASDHDFRAAAFHKKCDKQENTLVLISNQKGRAFGGFTHYPWQTPKSETFYVEDLRRRAFIFSLDMMEKFEPMTNCTIVHSKKHGPCFGNKKQFDIEVQDECDKSAYGSHSIFPANYNRSGANKLERNKETSWKFSGGQKNPKEYQRFKITEYQVFKVCYK